MMCTFCSGKLNGDTTEYVEKLGNFIIVIQNVPCEKCTQCGETYINNSVVIKLEEILEEIKIVTSEISVAVIDYSKKIA